ncbi:MAG: glycosyltransferase family 39 protein [Verrucomicrobiales bacterium]|jgi:4-amino-4-deoxy-L-arabinose transferase-like glycosyltransferase|nr:glycosyltransferase family 39 protein [Verrucomicrobiales bacterium]
MLGERVSHFLIVAGVLVSLLILGMGSRGLNEPDEGRYANIGASLLNPQVSWLEPRQSGYAHYDKPPLIYYATALSFKTLGVNEWSARMPSLLGAVLTLTGVAWTAFRLYGARTAWWTLVISGTMAQFWLLARFLTPDMLLTGWCALAVAAWAEARQRGGSWAWWSASVLCWTLAWWTKATPALVPLGGLIVALLVTRDRAGWRALRPARLLVAVVALGLPWYVLLVRQHPELWDFFWHRQMIGHMAGGSEARKSVWWYYLALSPLFWLPWSLLVAGLLFRVNRENNLPAPSRQDAKFNLTVGGWLALTGLLVFTLNSSKLPTYTLTIAPWTGLALARLFVCRANERWQTISLTVTGLFCVGLLAVHQWVYLPRYQSSIGANSSLREVAATLNRDGARAVVLDRYWPGMEIYFSGDIIYTVNNPVWQRVTDRSVLAAGRDVRFVPVEELRFDELPPELWLVHYRKVSRKALEFFNLPPDAADGEVIGDFTLWKIRR